MSKQLTKEEAKEEIKKLVEKYKKYSQDDEFIKNERQACDSLIRPFFRDILGWDIDNPYEFKSEYSQGGKRVDYLVCLDGISQFIIEAKAPSREIIEKGEFYKQAIQYAEYKDKDFAILTNFTTVIILRAGIQAGNVFNNELRRIDLLKLSDENLDFLLYFAKNFWVDQGENNPLYLIKNLKKKKKIDEELIEDMSKWRERLITNLNANQKLKLNFEDEKEFSLIEEEIQRFIDRLIFICSCEDKQLNDNQLKSFYNEKRKRPSEKNYLLNKIKEIFREYHRKYNSDLFEEGLCDQFILDDDFLLQILEDLRSPLGKLPYDFSIIDADILGRAYEGFLGHTTTGKKRFKEKKDIGKRKEQGIYYTPQHIVNYIVLNTVREKVKNLSFQDILKIKILDPACGSGSFLIKAFDILVEEAKRSLNSNELTYEQKKSLLLNCIYGVDLDERACDIAKLNLSLKIASRGEKIPILHSNIKNGDSLINDEKIAGDKSFNWEKEFPFKFDIVIGNPPYVEARQIEQIFIDYYRKNFNSAGNRINTFPLFLEKSIIVMKDEALFGMIIHKNSIRSNDYVNLRRFVLDNCRILKILTLESGTFKDVTGEMTVIIFEKNSNEKLRHKNIVLHGGKGVILSGDIKKYEKISQDLFYKIPGNRFNIYLNENKIKVLNKIKESSKELKEFAETKQGIIVGDEKKYIKNKKETEKYKPVLRGRDISRYILMMNIFFMFLAQGF